MRPFLLVVPVAALVLGGCERTREPSMGTVLKAPGFVMPGRAGYTRDSAGIEILDFPLSVKGLPEVFSIDSHPILDLGGKRESATEQLSALVDDQFAIRLPDGRHMVRDYVDLKIFDREARFLTSIGTMPHDDSGVPEQLHGFCLLQGDTVVAIARNRAGIFTMSGRQVRAFRAWNGTVESSGCFRDGTMLVLTDRRPDSTAVARMSANARRVRNDGSDVRLIASVEAGSSSPNIPFWPNNAVYRDQVVSGDGRKAEIRVWRMNGRLRRIIRWNESPVLVTPNLLRDVVRYSLPPITEEELENQIEDAFTTPQPSSLPVYQRVLTDEAGRIWMLDHHDMTTDVRPPLAWTVFDSTGAPLGRVAQPSVSAATDPPRITWIGRDDVLLRWTDSDSLVHLTYHKLRY